MSFSPKANKSFFYNGRIRSLRVLLLLLMSCFLSSNLNASENYGALSGKVIDRENNTILSFVTIKAFKENSKEFVQTTSDISGAYIFPRLDEGIYEIRATLVGYKEYTNKIGRAHV